MLVVDSGVWIDFFRGAATPQRATLRRSLHEGEVRIVVPDLVFYEVLRGFRHEREFRQARLLMETLGIESVGGAATPLDGAQHYRSLRTAGVTVRSGFGVLIATFCIENGYALPHRDRDYDSFESRGLRTWRH